MKRILRDVVRRSEFWPEERQESAARVLLQMEAQARTPLDLTETQLAEIKLRHADSSPRFLSLHDARSRFAKRGA